MTILEANQTFFITDDGAIPQWVKQTNTTEYMIVEVLFAREAYFVKQNLVNVEKHTDEEILNEIRPFGYETIQELEDECLDSKNQIIAECFAENRIPETSDDYFIFFNRSDVKEKLKRDYHIEWTLGEEWFDEKEEDEDE